MLNLVAMEEILKEMDKNKDGFYKGQIAKDVEGTLVKNLWNSNILSPSYITACIDNNPSLDAESVRQLQAIQKLLIQYPGAKINTDRLCIRDNLVYMDGYSIPTQTQKVKHKDIRANPKAMTHPGCAKAWLTFVANIKGKEFYFSPQYWDRLQDKTIHDSWQGDQLFEQEMNTPDNCDITKALYTIIAPDPVMTGRTITPMMPIGVGEKAWSIYLYEGGFCKYTNGLNHVVIMPPSVTQIS